MRSLHDGSLVPWCEQRGPGGVAGSRRCAHAGWWPCMTTIRERAHPTSTSRYGRPPALCGHGPPCALAPMLLTPAFSHLTRLQPSRGWRGGSRASKWLADARGRLRTCSGHSRHSGPGSPWWWPRRVTLKRGLKAHGQGDRPSRQPPVLQAGGEVGICACATPATPARAQHPCPGDAGKLCLQE